MMSRAASIMKKTVDIFFRNSGAQWQFNSGSQLFQRETIFLFAIFRNRQGLKRTRQKQRNSILVNEKKAKEKYRSFSRALYMT